MFRPFARCRRQHDPSASPVATQPQAAAPARVEELEGRQLFNAAPFVTSMTSDNRGEVIFNTDRSLNPSSVHTRSVLLFSLGADGLPLTADDIKWPIRPIYTESNRQLRIRPLISLPAGDNYFVKLSARQIFAWDGMKLDGEFNGAGFRTGNGAPYGDLLMISRKDKSASPVARFYTNHGGINVQLNRTDAPNTVNNFLHYANESAWDGTFYHRSHSLGGNPLNKIIQGGGFAVDTVTGVETVHAHDPINNEFGNSNVRGTIAMAKTSDPNSATNQWFFNVGDNSQALDNPLNAGGFTVFGNVVGDSSFAVMDLISNLEKRDVGADFGAEFNGVFSELPVNPGTGSTVDPNLDVVSIRRVAILNKIGPLIV